MTKTYSAKKAKSANKSPVMKQQKFTSKQRKNFDEIDEIFAGNKRKKPENENTETKKPVKDSSAKVEPLNKMKMKRKIKNRIPEDNLFAEAPSRARKKTGDGLDVYTEDELGIGKPDAGGTGLCPFDCDCCF